MYHAKVKMNVKSCYSSQQFTVNKHEKGIIPLIELELQVIKSLQTIPQDIIMNGPLMDYAHIFPYK